jgi:hypothetical protein
MSDNTHGFPQGFGERRRTAIVTRDHDRIRQWAARHQAQPATGEAAMSCPPAIDARDQNAGIRFNFPGSGRFRPITWDEWFHEFDSHALSFVYEREVADRTYDLWDGRPR